jgi:hypothetical protein
MGSFRTIPLMSNVYRANSVASSLAHIAEAGHVKVSKDGAERRAIPSTALRHSTGLV